MRRIFRTHRLLWLWRIDMTGMIQGGWEFVWSVYGITWAGLILYGISLHLRERAQ